MSEKKMPNVGVVDYFRVLWDQINAKRAPWDENPWVWVVSFRRPEQ